MRKMSKWLTPGALNAVTLCVAGGAPTISEKLGSYDDYPPHKIINKYISSYLYCDTYTCICNSNTHCEEHLRAACVSNSAKYAHTGDCASVYATHDTDIDESSTVVFTTDTFISAFNSNHTMDSIKVATCNSSSAIHDANIGKRLR